MANDYYNSSGYPGTNAQGSSLNMRTELANISAGLDKLPSITGNALRLLRVNAAGTALESFVDTFVTAAALATTLGSYVTSTALTTALGSYVTSSSLTTTLGSYVLSSTLSSYVTNSSLATTLGSYVTGSALSTSLGSYVAKAGSTMTGDLLAPNFLVGNGSTTAAGSFGFGSSNGPSIAAYGTAASGSPGCLLFTISGSEKLRLDANGKLVLGGSAAQGKLTVVTANGSVSGPGAWGNEHVAIGPNVGSSTGSGVGIGYDTTTDGGFLFSIAPSVAWKKLTIGSAGLDFNTATGSLGLRLTAAGLIQDGAGNELGYRGLVTNILSTSQTAAYAQRGQLILLNASAITETIPSSVFNQGDTLTIYNNSGGACTIGQGSGLTFKWGASSTSGNRALANNGMATIYFITPTVALITGSGLS